MFLKYHIGCFKDTNFAPVDPNHTHFQIESFETRLNGYFQIMSKWSFQELKIYWSIFIHLFLDKFIKATLTDHFSSLGGLHQRIVSSSLSRCFFSCWFGPHLPSHQQIPTGVFEATNITTIFNILTSNINTLNILIFNINIFNIFIFNTFIFNIFILDIFIFNIFIFNIFNEDSSYSISGYLPNFAILFLFSKSSF